MSRKLEPAVRALVALWCSRGTGPLSIRVRLVERFAVDVSYEILTAHIDDMRPVIDSTTARKPWGLLLGVEDDDFGDKEIAALEHEVRVRSRILAAWQSRIEWDQVVMAAKLLGRDARFAKRVVEEFKRAPSLRGIRRRGMHESASGLDDMES